MPRNIGQHTSDGRADNNGQRSTRMPGAQVGQGTGTKVGGFDVGQRSGGEIQQGRTVPAGKQADGGTTTEGGGKGPDADDR